VVGFFTSELGVGEVARQLIGAFDAAVVPALPVRGSLVPPSRQRESFEYGALEDAAFAVNLLCINGDGIPVFAREAGRLFFAGRRTIAYWWWEVGPPPPSWSAAYEFVDEVWVASQYVYDLIAPSSPRPVVKLPLPLVAPHPEPLSRSELGLPEEGFIFLFAYDYHSVYARKNPEAVIDAFTRAFPAGGGAKLVLKCINSGTHPEQHERVLLAAGRHPDVVVLDGYVSSAEKDAITARSDCVVSLHRSEGFGLGLAEAMLLGKPVIATRFGGNLEYMNDQNSYLVDYRLTEVGEGAYPYAPDASWAEPSAEHAAQLMRRVFERQDEARARGELARASMLARHSPQVAGQAMRDRLELIVAEMQNDGARSLAVGHLPSALAERRARTIPSVDWGKGKLGRMRWRAQRPLADWARSFIQHQSEVDGELRIDISRLDERLREVAAALNEKQADSHAEIMAALRRLADRDPDSDETPGAGPR
jgi:glycosyltransferase involved in cell wall biosynthesis